MPTYSYNVIVNVGINSTSTNTGAQSATTQLNQVQTAANQTGQAVTRNMNQVNASLANSQKQLGIWGQAFRGAFVGAVAGMTFSTIISGITGIASGLKDAVVGAVQAGAEFEKTRNSLIVFAGSAADADRELAALDATARNTPGLRMVDAEQGYRQLRALGFEAENSRKLIAGLGKERLLSGADETAVQRVIVNLTQLASGSTRASMDIKEIIHSMPTLRKEFALAFGTNDPKRIAKIFSDDADLAVQKLSNQLEKTKGAAGGLSDAWNKFDDSIIQAGRDISTAALPALTDVVHELTTEVDKNSLAWKAWGEGFANIVVGLDNFVHNQGDRVLFWLSAATDVARVWLGVMTLGISEAATSLAGKAIGSIESSGQTTRERDARIKNFEEKPTFDEYVKQKTGLSVEEIRAYDAKLDEEYKNNPVPFGTLAPKQSQLVDLAKQYDNPYFLLAKKAKAFNDKNRAEMDAYDEKNFLKKQRQEEKQRADSLAKIDTYEKQVANIRESSFAIQAAKYKDDAQKLFEIQQKNYEQEIADTKTGYDEKLKLEEKGTIEYFKVQVEGNNKIRKLQSEEEVNRIRFEQEQFEKRRQNLLTFNELSTKEVESSYTRQIAVIQRGVDEETIAISSGYAEIADLTVRQSNIEKQLTIEKYNLQSQQAGLNAQERINIEKDMFLALEDLAQSSYDKLIDLNNKRAEAESTKIKKQVDNTLNLLNQIKEGYSSVESAFQTNLNYREGINPINFVNAFNSEGQSLLNSKTSFEAQTKSLAIKQDLERGGLLIQIKLNNDLLTIEKDRAVEAEKIYISNLQLRKENTLLMQDRARGQGRTSDVESYDLTIRDLDGQISKHRQDLDLVISGKQEIETATTKQLNADNKLLVVQQKTLTVTQDLEQTDLKRKGDLKYIADFTNDILQGKKDTILLEMRQLSVAQERQSLAETVRKLEIEITKNDENADLKVRAELLQHIVDLRDQETDAVIRMGKAQIDISRQLVYSKNRADADLLEFLASQKGITEILSDTRINVIKSAYDGLDTVIGKLTKSFGAFGSVVKDLLSNLIKLALNSVFQKFFGVGTGQSGGGGFSIPGFGGASGSGGFSFPGFGVGGIGGTAPFNPNSGSTTLGGFPINPSRYDLLQPGSVGGSASSATGATGLFGGLLGTGLFGGILGAGLGLQAGGGRGLGGVLGIAGGGLLGVGGALITSGLLTGGLAGLSTALLGTGIGAIGLPILIGAILLGRNAARRRDERTRNTLMVDALKNLDDLIGKVNNDQIDGASALSQADQIRQQYLDGANALKDKKTRNIALKDVSRLDAKISDLKTAISNQLGRQERMKLLVPTFADGGTLSQFGSNFKNNPLGYQSGIGSGREDNQLGYFPSANQYARYSNTEFILDAETTRNVGVGNLNRMLLTKGKSFNYMQDRLHKVFPGRAMGGMITMAEPNGTTSSACGTGGITIEVHPVIQVGAETMVQIAQTIVKNNDGSPSQFTAQAKAIDNVGNNEFLQKLLKFVNENTK